MPVSRFFTRHAIGEAADAGTAGTTAAMASTATIATAPRWMLVGYPGTYTSSAVH